jgi:dipeptidyl aminopeptidase/acylaminoacyl peptidase
MTANAMRSMNCLVAAMCFAGSLQIHAAAQTLDPLPIEDVVGTRSFALYSGAQISPDGKLVVYVAAGNRQAAPIPARDRTRTGIPGTPFTGDICISEIASGESQCRTRGRNNNWAPAWSPNSRHLAFLSDRDGSGQAKVWIWDAVSDQLRKVSDVSVRASRIEWLDNERLILTALPDGITPTEYAARTVKPDGASSETGQASDATVLLYRSSPGAEDRGKGAQSPQWSLEHYLRDLVIVETGRGAVRSIDRGHRVSAFSTSPDGSQVAFTSPIRFANSTTQQILFDLVLINLKTGERRTAAADIPLGYDGSSFSWSPDGFRLAFQTNGGQGSGACYVVESSGMSPPRKVTEFLQKSPSTLAPPLWDGDGRHIYFINGGALWHASVEEAGKSAELSKIAGRRIVQLVAGPQRRIWSPSGRNSTIVLTQGVDSTQSGFYSIDLKSGESSRILEDGRCFTCTVQQEWLTAGGESLAYFAGDAQHDNDLWLADAKFESPRRLTHLNPQFDKYQMGMARLVEWQSLDGEALKGALLLPAGYLPGKRYPLIVHVYGGAFESKYLNHFGFGYAGADNMQLFATHGYAVLMPDAPQHLGTPMLDLAKTILPGVNKVIEMGIADPDRLGIMGHSYGGYTTLCLIAQTTRFKAAVMSAGTGDLVASYGEMHKDGSTYQVSIMQTGQGLMGGAPWQFLDRYIENSPIFHLDRIETPLLIIHGAEDQAVASVRSDEVFVGLRRLGKEVEYAKYEGEDHTPLGWSYANQLDYCARLLAWFDKYLKRSTH